MKEEKGAVIKGILLSKSGGLVVKSGDRLYLNPEGMVILPELPKDFITKPTLKWLLRNDKPGKHDIEISYLTSGIDWKADYVFAVNKENTKADLNVWVTLDNKSGKTYEEAKLKLVAGDVHRAEPERKMMRQRTMVLEDTVGAPGFQEKDFFEYHMYTLGRKTTLKDNEMKQVEFAGGAGIPVSKVFVYEGQKNAKKVLVKIEFENKKENSLGIPLPKGRVRVYQPDDDGSLIFIGEDEIDHTPKDEKLSLAVGNAFDITGERKQTQSQSGNDWRQESYEITLKNHKKEEAEVKVRESFWNWNNWKVLNASPLFRKIDSRTIEFVAKIPPSGETKVSYTVKYWW